MEKYISVVIPVLNSESTIRECLQSLFENEFKPGFEVIVVDGGSIDSTRDIVSEFPAKLITGGGIPAKSRNIGIKNAQGEIIAFTDSDCVVDKNWFNILSRNFKDPKIASVGGPNLTPKSDPFLAQCIGALMESFLGSAGVRNTVVHKKVLEVKHNPPVNAAVRKSILIDVGCFNPNFTVSEDVELDSRIIRQGYKLVYDPEMVVYHHRRRDLKGFIKQLMGYGRGRASAFLKDPESLPLTYFAVAFFFVATSLSIPVYYYVNLLRPLIFYGWVCYVLFLFLSTIYLIFSKKSIYLIILPFLAFVEHISLGLGFIWGLINPYR